MAKPVNPLGGGGCWPPWSPEPPSEPGDPSWEGWDQSGAPSEGGLPPEEFELDDGELEWLFCPEGGPEWQDWTAFGANAATCPACLGRGWVHELKELPEDGSR